jgi:hypothetical protein
MASLASRIGTDDILRWAQRHAPKAGVSAICRSS